MKFEDVLAVEHRCLETFWQGSFWGFMWKRVGFGLLSLLLEFFFQDYFGSNAFSLWAPPCC